MPRNFMRNVRRTLRKEPDWVKRPVAQELERGARKIQADAVRFAPRDTGRLRDALASPRAIGKREKGMRWEFGLRTKALQRLAYHAPMVEFGTKGYQRGDKRTSSDNRGRAQLKSIKRNIPARPAQPFLRPSIAKNMPVVDRKVAKAAGEAFRRQFIRHRKGKA